MTLLTFPMPFDGQFSIVDFWFVRAGISLLIVD